MVGDIPHVTWKCGSLCFSWKLVGNFVWSTSLSQCNKTKGPDESKRIYKCDKCNLKYTTRGSLNRHKADFHEGKEMEYKCKLCDQSYSDKQQLKEHISNIHHGMKKFKCDRCGKTYTDQRNLRIHLKNYHKLKIKEVQKPKKFVEKNFKCEICYQMYSTKGSLKSHHGVFTSWFIQTFFDSNKILENRYISILLYKFSKKNFTAVFNLI